MAQHTAPHGARQASPVGDRPNLRVIEPGQPLYSIATSPVDRIEAMHAMAADPDATARLFKLAAVIAAYASSKTGFAFPSVETLANETGINRRDVQRELRRMEDKGWIIRRRGGGAGKASSYALVKTAGESPTLFDETAGGTAGERAGDSTQKGRVEQRVIYPPQPGEPGLNQDNQESVRVCEQQRAHSTDARVQTEGLSPAASPETPSADEDAAPPAGSPSARHQSQDLFDDLVCLLRGDVFERTKKHATDKQIAGFKMLITNLINVCGPEIAAKVHAKLVDNEDGSVGPVRDRDGEPLVKDPRGYIVATIRELKGKAK